MELQRANNLDCECRTKSVTVYVGGPVSPPFPPRPVLSRGTRVGITGEKAPLTQAKRLRVAADYSAYLGAVAGACFAGCWTEPFPVTIASAPNGGPALAGNSGRNTANACEANAMETTMIAAAAHLMVGGLIKIQQHNKQKILRDPGN